VNLASEPAHAGALKTMRSRLDRWMIETCDQGPESESRYDSDMAAYLGHKPNPAIQKNINLMKQWAAEERDPSRDQE